ncbi:MAG: transposase [Pirellulaceae bacterium]
MAASEMKETAFIMTPDDREVVEATVLKHCEIRDWSLHAVNARSNHMHVVVTSSGYSPETVRDQFKAWCSQKLKSSYPERKRFWTEGASRRYLNTEEELEAAVMYVRDAQDRKGIGD